MPSKSVERRLEAQGVETRERYRLMYLYPGDKRWRGTSEIETKREAEELRANSADWPAGSPLDSRIEVRTVTVGPWRRVEEE
jgi:hypothetical protein